MIHPQFLKLDSYPVDLIHLNVLMHIHLPLTRYLIAILSKQLEFDSLGVIQSIDENLHQTTSSIYSNFKQTFQFSVNVASNSSTLPFLNFLIKTWTNFNPKNPTYSLTELFNRKYPIGRRSYHFVDNDENSSSEFRVDGNNERSNLHWTAKRRWGSTSVFIYPQLFKVPT